MVPRLPNPSLVVLAGPSGSGKSTWAVANFADSEVASSDRLRAIVGEGEHDLDASRDAFDLLEEVVERRLRRGLLTVVDTLGLDAKQRSRWREIAGRHGVPCYVVPFDTPAEVCRDRNRNRDRPIPARALASQLKRWKSERDAIEAEGFDAVLSADPVAVVAPGAIPPAATKAPDRAPRGLQFGLHLSNFDWPGGREALGSRLRVLATAAEDAGFSRLSVMDHFRQIPRNGPEWLDMPEAYVTLSSLASVTTSIRLGVLVTGVTYRNPALVAKMTATLDVLSGGRAWCGIGAGWFEREHAAYGWEFPGAKARLDLLEDTLQLLPLMWGPGSPAFVGKVISVPEAMCYPRPLQDPVPILVGGSGERRTLRLVADYADECNLFGDAATVRHKVRVLHDHCAAAGRDPEDVEVTHLSTTLVGRNRAEVAAKLDRLVPANGDRSRFAAANNADTVPAQIDRFAELASAGVETAFVTLPDVADPTAIATFGEIIAAFR